MKEIEKLLRQEKERVDLQKTPSELEGRLQNSLFNQKPPRKKKTFIWKTVTAILIALTLFGYNFEALAYYGKKILGFDEVTTGTLQQLNEAGMGQVVDKSIKLERGITFTINGVMTDENRMIIYYTMKAENGEIEDVYSNFSPTKVTGFLTDSRFESGGGKISPDHTEVKGTFNFEPPSGFAKHLTLHFNGTNEEIEFEYDPTKAMQTRIKQAIEQEINVDGGSITFKSIIASPTLTVIKGIASVEEIGRVMQPFGKVSLIANGKKVIPRGRNVSSSVKGTEFSLEFDALPQDLNNLRLKVFEFVGYDELNEKFTLEEGKVISIAGEELVIKQVIINEKRTEVTIATDESVSFDKMSIGDETYQQPLEKTVGQRLKKLSDHMEKERTLIFKTTKNPRYLFIGGMHYMKTYNKVIDIPIN